MMYQVHLTVTGFCDVPRDALRRDNMQDALRPLRSQAGQSPLVLPDPPQNALHGPAADLAQLGQHLV